MKLEELGLIRGEWEGPVLENGGRRRVYLLTEAGLAEARRVQQEEMAQARQGKRFPWRGRHHLTRQLSAPPVRTAPPPVLDA
jgi:DNA-binding PadR family transcriptional regulator